MPHVLRLPGFALAVTVIVASSSIASAAPSPGGASAPVRAVVTGATCNGTAWVCPRGSTVELEGEGLGDVAKVVFLGRAGAKDDRATRKVAAGEGGRLQVRVPAGARSGPLRLVTPGAGTVKTARGLRVVRAAAVSAQPAEGEQDLAPGKPLLAGSRQRVRLAIGLSPTTTAAEVVNADSGLVVRQLQAPAGASSVAWDGTAAGQPVAPGRYQLRLTGATTAQAARATAPVEVRDAIFPIRGPHDLGQSATNDFGGERGHRGQDLFAKCGTPLVAVRPATVQFVATQDRAGNYVVLQDASGQSYAYMHMRDPSLVRKGQKVYAGQRVGYVGETGRASGCHLHFELWTAPGWYTGGKAVDPLPELRRWEAFG